MDKHNTLFELRAIAQEPFATIALVSQQGNLIPAAILPYHFIDFDIVNVLVIIFLANPYCRCWRWLEK